MAASADPRLPPPDGAARSRPGRWDAARIAVVTALGGGSGWLSWRIERWLEDLDSAAPVPEELVYLPGLVYAVLWLGVAWMPGLLLVRERVRRSAPWSLLMLGGIVASYVMAYQTAFNATIWLDARSWFPKDGPAALIAGGILGGAVGGAGLVNLWSLLFPGAEDWTPRSLLIALGAALGGLLGICWVTGEGAAGLSVFFPAWQGGMAAALAAADVWKRRREAGG